MRKAITFLLLLVVGQMIKAQTLGFSTISPVGASHSSSTSNQLFLNGGEPLNRLNRSDEACLQNGLLAGAQLQSPRSFVSVRFWSDENQDGEKDANEPYISIGSMALNGEIYSNNDRDGIIIFVEPGEYEASFNTLGSFGYPLTSIEIFNFTINESSNWIELEFGLYIDPEDCEISLNLFSESFRCNDTVWHCLSVFNESPILKHDTIWFNYDARIEDIFFTGIEPDLTVNDSIFGWICELKPNEKKGIVFDLAVPGISDNVAVGDTFYFSAWSQLNGFSEKKIIEKELRCSYDPNDKLVYPDRPDHYVLFEQELLYTLRFQNTGNDYAENVVVTDTLSKDLDISTFNVLYTTHPNQLRVVHKESNPHIVDFRFNQIFLPDSTTNLEGSNGLVTFSISPNNGIEEFTEISNTAHIYFDYNPAIVTNTVNSIYVEEYPVIIDDNQQTPLLSKDEELLTLPKIKIFPNPTTGVVYFDQQIPKIVVYNTLGQKILIKEYSQSVNLNGYKSGSYLLECIHENSMTQFKKIIKTDFQ